MKKIIRTLDFYGFDQDNTMYDVNSTPISKVTEIKNEKYCRVKNEEGNESSENGDNDSATNPTGNTTTPTNNGGEESNTWSNEPTLVDNGEATNNENNNNEILNMVK